MSIRRTRQQKIKAELHRGEGSIRYQSPGAAPTQASSAGSESLGHKKRGIESHFAMDMQKTAVSTLIVLVMLAVTYWFLR